MSNIIREPKQESDYEGCINVTKSAWTGIPETEQIPIHIMKAAHRTGKFLVAENDGQIVGYVMCFAGLKDTLYLHAIGVGQESKSSGVGEDLFHRVLQDSVAEDLSEMTLTFSPLLGANANLFIHKMGGVVLSPNDYERDAYADTKNEVTGGDVPSDRLVVHYDFKSELIRRIAAGQKRPQLEPNTEALEVPAEFNSVKKDDPQKATEIALSVRKTIEAKLAKGYRIIDFVSTKDEVRRNYYVFEK